MTAPIPQPKHLNYSLREQNVFEPLASRTQGYYDIYYPVRLVKRLRLGFSHLREHKFRHNFSNSSRRICGDGDETTEHFLLRCRHFANTRSTLFEQVFDILKTDIKVLPEHRLVEILLYGDNNCDEIANKLITEATITFIKFSKRFDT